MEHEPQLHASLIVQVLSEVLISTHCEIAIVHYSLPVNLERQNLVSWTE
jgi:hypothetical protein